MNLALATTESTTVRRRRPTKLKKPPVARPARMHEERYAKQLRLVFRAINKLAIQRAMDVAPELFKAAPLPRTDSIRTDGVTDILDLLAETLFASIRAITESRAVQAVVNTAVSTAERVSLNAIDKQFKSVLGIPYPAFGTNIGTQLELARVDNIALIKGLGDEVAKKVHGTVARLSRQGVRVEDLGKALSHQTGFSVKRATLIARDQTQKLHGELTRLRQTDAGIKKYTWSTSLDERVRPEHAERHGQEFTWSSPPDDGHPGNPVLCRCVAVPVFDF